jgi:hypothetical protein
MQLNGGFAPEVVDKVEGEGEEEEEEEEEATSCEAKFTPVSPTQSSDLQKVRVISVSVDIPHHPVSTQLMPKSSLFPIVLIVQIFEAMSHGASLFPDEDVEEEDDGFYMNDTDKVSCDMEEDPRKTT